MNARCALLVCTALVLLLLLKLVMLDITALLDKALLNLLRLNTLWAIPLTLEVCALVVTTVVLELSHPIHAQLENTELLLELLLKPLDVLIVLEATIVMLKVLIHIDLLHYSILLAGLVITVPVELLFLILLMELQVISVLLDLSVKEVTLLLYYVLLLFTLEFLLSLEHLQLLIPTTIKPNILELLTLCLSLERVLMPARSVLQVTIALPLELLLLLSVLEVSVKLEKVYLLNVLLECTLMLLY